MNPHLTHLCALALVPINLSSLHAASSPNIVLFVCDDLGWGSTSPYGADPKLIRTPIHKIYVENRRIFGLRSDRISPYGRSFYGTPYTGYDAPQRDEPEVMEETTRRAADWISNRKQETPFFLYFAAVAVHHPILPSKRNFGSSAAGAYGDFIHDVDHSVGQLMETLQRRGQLENTIFIFTSDNGGDIPPKNKDNPPELQALEAGLKINGKWRGDKHTIYEGGFRVPLIVSYPKQLAGGVRSAAYVTTADFFATIAEMHGIKDLPETSAPDSFSFAHILRDTTALSKRPHTVLNDVKGRQALRFGKWKMIDAKEPNSKDPDIELYDIDADPSETLNVAPKHPEIIEQGQKLLQAIRDADSSRKMDGL